MYRLHVEKSPHHSDRVAWMFLKVIGLACKFIGGNCHQSKCHLYFAKTESMAACETPECVWRFLRHRPRTIVCSEFLANYMVPWRVVESEGMFVREVIGNQAWGGPPAGPMTITTHGPGWAGGPSCGEQEFTVHPICIHTQSNMVPRRAYGK